MHPPEHLGAGHPGQPLRGEHERDLGALLGEPLEPLSAASGDDSHTTS